LRARARRPGIWRKCGPIGAWLAQRQGGSRVRRPVKRRRSVLGV
jgi:hypothetical protein